MERQPAPAAGVHDIHQLVYIEISAKYDDFRPIGEATRLAHNLRFFRLARQTSGHYSRACTVNAVLVHLLSSDKQPDVTGLQG